MKSLDGVMGVVGWRVKFEEASHRRMRVK